jgi:hypothetical protein
MKTTRQHFEENLTEEELEKALANTPNYRLEWKEVSPSDDTPSSALLGAFVWSKTPEGGEYWDAIYTRLYNQQK